MHSKSASYGHPRSRPAETGARVPGPTRAALVGSGDLCSATANSDRSAEPAAAGSARRREHCVRIFERRANSRTGVIACQPSRKPWSSAIFTSAVATPTPATLSKRATWWPCPEERYPLFDSDHPRLLPAGELRYAFRTGDVFQTPWDTVVRSQPQGCRVRLIAPFSQARR
jgi:hypothetical protein